MSKERNPDEFEKSLRASLLVEEEEILMPSFIDALGELDLADAITIERMLESQAGSYRESREDLGITVAPEEFVGFVIPLDAYIPIVDGYSATTITPRAREEIAKTSIVSLTSVTPTVTVGANQIRMRLSVALVCLGDHDATHQSISDLYESEILLNQYRHALEAANDIVLAYKLTPTRHNHNVAPVTLLGRPGGVEVIRCRLSDPVVISERETITFHANTLAGVLHAREIHDEELNGFRTIHALLGSVGRYPPILLRKVYEAIDARCKGQDDIAVVLADTYAEHILRYFMYQVLVPDVGEDEAARQVDDLRTMKRLLKAMASKLSLSLEEFKMQLQYEDWKRDCRNLRNSLTHVFIEHYISGEDSQRAIAASIGMVQRLLALIESKFEDSSGIFFDLLRSVTWNSVIDRVDV